METGYLIAFPVFYEVEADSVKRQTGSFGNTLLKTEDYVRNKVDRRSYKSILETEDRIWGWRQALVYIGGSFGFSHKEGPDGTLISNIVVKLEEILYEISYQRDKLFVIEQSLMHPQKAATSLLQALNIKKSDIEDLITRPFIQTRGSASTDHLVFLDLITLNNPILGQRLLNRGQAGMIFLVLLGSVDIYDEDFDFKPLLLSKKHRLFPGNKLIVSSQEIQDQTHYSPVQVTNSADVLAMAESNGNTPNRLGEDKNSDCSLTCFSFSCNIMKRFAMMISPPPPKVFISFGEKQLEKNLVSSLKQKLELNGISVYVEEDETKERIKESKVAIVVFSDKYPVSAQCLDELVKIEKLMNAGEINPFPIFYKPKDVTRLAKSVKELKGFFRNRLLKIEQEVRKTVNRGNVNSILDTEARIWGWRQAIKSISSKPGLSNEHSSDHVFFTDVVTKVKELFEFKDKPKKSSSDITTNQVTEEKTIMHQQETAAVAITTARSLDDDLFYSLPSFLEALDFEITDLEGFTAMHNRLISLSLKSHTNLVCLKLGSLENLVQFQCSKSFEFLRKVFAVDHSGISRLEEPSRVLAIESNQPQQQFDTRLIVSSQNHQHHINQVQSSNYTTSEANMF
ncbi:Disease resistance protein [Hirschfeldia incana]|nr:Disease resistance protein [Hirschfeldia incana]